MRIVSFNILTHRASQYVLAGKRTETELEWVERYELIIKELQILMAESTEIICLQEVSPEFAEMLKVVLQKEESDKNKYWLVYTPNVYKQAILIDINRFSYRFINNNFYKDDPHSKIQTVLIHQNHPEIGFYLANVHLTGRKSESGSKNHLTACKVY